MAKMQILSSAEKRAFDNPPELNAWERKSSFDFSNTILKIAGEMRTPLNKAVFLLLCGYFKSTRKIYLIESFHQKDIDYVLRKYFKQIENVNLSDYSRKTLLRHREIILHHYGFEKFGEKQEEQLNQDIKSMLNSQLKPKLIFYRCVDILTARRIEIPSYHKLSELILLGLHQHDQHLADVLERNLSNECKRELGVLLEKHKDSRYWITLLKKVPQSMTPGRIKESTEDLKVIEEIFEKVISILEKLNLSSDALRYLAGSVIRGRSIDLMRKSDSTRYLHLIAFIAHQYYRRRDALIDIILQSQQSAGNAVSKEHKERCYANRDKQKKLLRWSLPHISKKSELEKSILQIISIAKNQSIPAERRNHEIIEIASSVLNKRTDESEDLPEQIQQVLNTDDYHDLLQAKSLYLQNRISPIIKNITFQGDKTIQDLLDALDYYREKNGRLSKESVPKDFLKPEQVKIIGNDEFNISLYKMFLFEHLASAIKSGRINLAHSYKYLPLDQYLISIEEWIQYRDQLLEKAGLLHFSDKKIVLDELEQILTRQYRTTNANFAKNAHVKINKKGRISLSTPATDKEESEENPLREYFPKGHYIPLSEILSTVDHHSEFLSELQHHQQRYNRKQTAPKNLIATLCALGCDIGTRKIARISRHLNPNELDTAKNWYFHPDSIDAANDRLLEYLHSLELPNIYRANQNALHTSSDGQKFEVLGDSLNANYSFKYTGKNKGSSVYSFIDERHLLFYTTVISSAEHESAYVIDGLMHNDVIQSSIHSTDTHGFNELIFATTHLLGISFAPRIKRIAHQHLRIFKSAKDIDKSKWAIQPNEYINREIIEEHWEDILRFITTIALKRTTASDIFRRLNSYSRHHDLYRALKAFGRITKSIFLLKYIDNLELRQMVQKQLNKIESSNKFSKALSLSNTREMHQTIKEDQEIAQSCRRLIKNVILCWNYLYLTGKLNSQTSTESRLSLLKSIKNHSVACWSHINILGEYDFSDEKLQDSIGILPPKPISFLNENFGGNQTDQNP